MTLALLAACTTGPDPSTTGGETSSVLVAPVSSGAYIGSAVLDGEGDVYVAVEQGQLESLDVVRFSPDVTLPSTWPAPPSDPEIEVAFAGQTLWWAANDGTGPSLWTGPAAAFPSAPGPEVTFVQDAASDVVGLVADGTAVYAALSAPALLPAGSPPPSVGPSPDSWQWPAATEVDTGFTGSIYRVVPGAMPPGQRLGVTGGITFFPGFMQHVLAQSSTNVYWVDSAPVGKDVGRVMTATKANWASDPGHAIGAIPSIDNLATGFVGLAASDSYVAWEQAPEPNFGFAGCWVFVSATKDGVSAAQKTIFDSDIAGTSFSCNGLALDADYAYFAMVEVAVPPAGVNSSILLGTGIGRVPLGGGALETVSLQSDRWYGPRRVLVDDTNVYAIDPSYVLRFPKTAFGP